MHDTTAISAGREISTWLLTEMNATNMKSEHVPRPTFPFHPASLPSSGGAVPVSLSRTTVTAASRIMLPTYVAFFAVVGLAMILTPQHRLHQTPAFAAADRVADLDLWGAGYTAIAAAMLLALVIARRSIYRAALAVAIVWMLAWACVTVTAAFHDLGGFAAWAWPAFVARACWASLVSLTTGEVGEPR